MNQGRVPWSAEEKIICLIYLKSDISCVLVFSETPRKHSGQADCRAMSPQSRRRQLIPNKPAEDGFWFLCASSPWPARVSIPYTG